ncbi:MAG: hypothetical protein JWQ97_1480 [Phenylobacterium sp.]|nr:hypothetical protein [Phenylobacterium sp.]
MALVRPPQTGAPRPTEFGPLSGLITMSAVGAAKAESGGGQNGAGASWR